MCIEQQFERSPENEMLGTVEKEWGKVHLKFFGESARVGVIIVLRYEVPSDHVRVY
jgi:hypothetical protein